MVDTGAGLPDQPRDTRSEVAASSDVGALLRIHRERQNITGGALAERVGLSQAKVSRIETGRTAASPADVRLLAAGLKLPAEETERLVDLAAQRTAPPHPRRRPAQVGIARQQTDVGRAEEAAREIRVFQSTVVAGLLQTSGYAEAILRTPLRLAGLAGADGSDAALLSAVAGRLRRQHILKLPDKNFFFVMTESVLANRLVNPEDMLAQIRRMRELAGQDNVSIRIIPADAPLIDAPINSYELIDDKLVLIDLYHTLVTSSAGVDIDAYQNIFDTMTGASVAGIDEILDKYVQVYRSELE
jgi:transcriptional regulator with XRE-family HTH domain